MLTSLIRFSLQHRMLIIAAALLLTGAGAWTTSRMPIDVFPDLNRPRVVIMTEAPGMAPEEVEALITIPLETAMNGATGVETVRSSSGVGLSVVNVEFEWGSDLYLDRQVVNERLQAVQEQLPRNASPQLAPVSSIMGQIVMLAMWSDDRDVSPMELRTAADWTVRPRLLTIGGVSQVFTMGGERRQFQVLVDPPALRRYDVSLQDVEQAIVDNNQNVSGGYLDKQGPNELLVRAIGRVQTLDDLRKTVVGLRDGRPVSLAQVAVVREAAQVRRGDSSAFVRNRVRAEESMAAGEPQPAWRGGPAVMLTINKQPGADTRTVTDEIMQTISTLQASLPNATRIEPIYLQKSFIDRAIANVVLALRDGGILVVVILFAFLMNLRTTFITLTAIPLSLMMTAVVFAVLGVSINTMTLGGLAVAIGELVDDAIVDVENIHRRLRENRQLSQPLHPLLVVFRASTEVRSSIVFSTMIVVLVFIPLFALGGIEGRLFAPLGVAYIVSILGSLLVSLTVTPVLSYWLLSGGARPDAHSERDGWLLRVLKRGAEYVIRFSLARPALNLGVTILLVGIAGLAIARLDRDFLPPFNEGSVQLNVLMPPGTSLATSTSVNQSVEQQLQAIPDIIRIGRRTGRAELDEHAEGVNTTEYIIELDPDSPRGRDEQLAEIRAAMLDAPWTVTAVEQPISHLISHMLSGVKAQIGIRLFGDDLDVLRQRADDIRLAMTRVPGITDVMVEPQVVIPQLRIELDRDQLLRHGLTAWDINSFIETALSGRAVSHVLVEQKTFELVVRVADDVREDLNALKRLAIELPAGGTVPLEQVARVFETGGPNTINRDNIRRRIIIQCNVTGRGVVDAVTDLQRELKPIEAELPPGYFLEFGGQFESQQSASRAIGWLSLVSLASVFLVLYTMFRSVNLSLQVMAALPMAFIGSVAALVLTGQSLSIAALVGFISLGGIASRNGILLLNHYLHLVRHEGESVTDTMIIRAGLERLAPVLMTALTAGIGLIPLVIAANQPGREILYPVATVILGGLISSTLLDFFVHPALFWLFGRSATARIMQSDREAVELVEAS